MGKFSYSISIQNLTLVWKGLDRLTSMSGFILYKFNFIKDIKMLRSIFEVSDHSGQVFKLTFN